MVTELRGQAQNRWTQLVLEYGDEIPPYPGVSVIKPARVPSPPKLVGSDPEQWALQLFRAYAAVVQRAPRPPRLDDLRRLPNAGLRTLWLAAPVFVERGTQPVPWCKFSLASWRRFGPVRLRINRSPPIQWVYGQASLEKADLWYQWSGATTGGSRLVFSRTHKALIRRYDKMRHALLAHAACKDLTAQDVRNIVAATLPQSLYRRAVDHAKLEVEMAQADIDSRLRRGADLWG